MTETRAKHDPEAAPHVEPREHYSDLRKDECRHTQRDAAESDIALGRGGSFVFAQAVGAEAWKRPKTGQNLGSRRTSSHANTTRKFKNTSAGARSVTPPSRILHSDEMDH